MTEVARRAGVSISTVSHIVNGTRPVSEVTRAAVVQAMEELGYQHQPIARSLGAGSNRSVGLAITVASNPYWIDVVSGIEEAAIRAGLDLIMVDTHDDPRHEARVVAKLLAHHVDGLILAPSAGWRGQVLPLLRERPIPTVLIDRLDPIRLDQVGVHNTEAAAQAVEHLAQHGHTRIGMVAGLDGLSTTVERIEGYVLAHRRLGLPIDPGLVVAGCSSTDGGRLGMLELLSRPNPPTAVFSANNSITVGVLAALGAKRKSIPGDIALAAFDDFPWAAFLAPYLTVVAQPLAQLGARAVDLLVRRLNQPITPYRTIRLQADLVIRSSCGCAREDAAS